MHLMSGQDWKGRQKSGSIGCPRVGLMGKVFLLFFLKWLLATYTLICNPAVSLLGKYAKEMRECI